MNKRNIGMCQTIAYLEFKKLFNMDNKTNYDVHDWILDTHGKIRQILSDNQQDLPYEDIVRLATWDEIPHSVHTIINSRQIPKILPPLKDSMVTIQALPGSLIIPPDKVDSLLQMNECVKEFIRRADEIGGIGHYQYKDFKTSFEKLNLESIINDK